IRDSIYITNDCWETWKAIVAPDEMKRYITQIITLKPGDISIYSYLLRDRYYSFWRTYDSGNNWQKNNKFNYSFPPNTKIRFIDSLTIWLCSSYSSPGVLGVFQIVLLKSTDGGINWDEKFVDIFDTLGSLKDIGFYDKNHGIVVGNDNKIYNTYDGGENWIREYKKFSLPIYPLITFQYVFANINEQFVFEMYANNYYMYRYNNKMNLQPPVVKYYKKTQYPDKFSIFWNNIEGATKYRIQIDFISKETQIGVDTTLFSNPEIDTIVIGTQLNLNSIPYNVNCVVRAQSLNDTQESDWYALKSPIYIASYKGQLLSLLIFNPKYYAYDVSLNPTYIWEKIEDASSYEFSLYETMYKDELVYKTSLSDTFLLSPIVLKPDTSYRFEIYYKVGDSTSPVASCSFKTIATTDVIDIDIQNQMKEIYVYPNPFVDFLSFKFEQAVTSDIGIEVFDIFGIERKKYKSETIDRIKINVSELSTGVYFVKVRTGGLEKVYKIIKVE
ncbi:MAG: T9SS type A sorting domain-containing protein, partial [Bacteroidota bacterium]